MSVWNGQYKQNPPNSNNPGYGAEAIRDLKTNIEGIVGREHNFDTDTVSGQGKHLPGSAIIALDEDTETPVDSGQIGRLKGSTTNSKTTLQVKATSTDLNIEGYNQVSKTGDETIAGIKTFTDAPAVTQIVDDGSSDTTLANVGYVKTKTGTTSITPSVINVTPATDLNLLDFNGNQYDTITSKPDTNNLEELLAQISGELAELRTAVQTNGLNNPFGQNLETTSIVTFGTVTADKVFNPVWG
jgi:hypothetical protein